MTDRTAQKTADVLIIGGGVTGITAAYFLSQSGVEVAVLSPGWGASEYITGFAVPVSAGDSLECFISDVVKSGQGQANPELVKTLCSESYDVIPFLKGIGFHFEMDGESYKAKRPLGSSYPRVIGHGNTSGSIILSLLTAKLSAMENVSVYSHMRALRLLEADGRVYGALCFDDEQRKFIAFQARQTILACGGFAGIYPFSTNTKDVGGDGIAMAYNAGLPLTDLEFVQFEPSAAVWPPAIRGEGMITTMLFEGAKMYNGLVERFMTQYGPDAERVNKDILGVCIQKEILAGKGTPHGGIWFDATGVGRERLESVYGYFVTRYEKVGIDISKEPVELAPAAHTSLGGVVVNPNCTTNLPGVLACGEIAGNIHGANRIGGMAGLETLVFGHKAAQTAQSLLKEETSVPRSWKTWDKLVDDILRPGGCLLSTEEMAEIRLDMQKTIDHALNLVRNGADLREAAGIFEKHLSRLSAAASDTPMQAFQRMRLENDLIASYLLALSALERTGSVGCHVRSDDSNESALKYRVEVAKGRQKPSVRRIALKA